MTPGPWIWNGNEIVTPNGTLLVRGVALPSGNHDLVEEAKANSIAIAALPDCLEALQVIEQLTRGTLSTHVHNVHNVAANALKKAGCV